MSTQAPFKLDCDEQFPHGLFAVAADAQIDFDKAQAQVPDAQARDKESGERIWVVRVIDNDPDSKSSEFKVKVIAPHCPTLPDPIPGTNFRPVTFKNLMVTPYVEERANGRSRVAYSFKATSIGSPAAAQGKSTRAA